LFDQDRETAALEFWKAYPILLRDSRTGENFSLPATNKQQFLRDYYTRIGHSASKHRRVMDAGRSVIAPNVCGTLAAPIQVSFAKPAQSP